MNTRRDPYTLDLFEVPQPAEPVPASADYRAVVAHMTGVALKQADGDRLDVAARMSRLTGADVSKYMLDAYASEGRETFNLPLWLTPALEIACDTHALTNWLVGVRGGRLYLGKDALEAELGRLETKREEVGRLIRQVKRRLGEDE